jgi:hypothetical protein
MKDNRRVTSQTGLKPKIWRHPVSHQFAGFVDQALIEDGHNLRISPLEYIWSALEFYRARLSEIFLPTLNPFRTPSGGGACHGHHRSHAASRDRSLLEGNKIDPSDWVEEGYSVTIHGLRGNATRLITRDAGMGGGEGCGAWLNERQNQPTHGSTLQRVASIACPVRAQSSRVPII